MSGTSNGTTTRDDFERFAHSHRVIPVVRELFSDQETPVGIYQKLAQSRPGSFLLESAEPGGIWSRYSFVGVSSFGVLTQSEDTTRWLDYGLDEDRALGVIDSSANPLDVVEQLLARWKTPRIDNLPPLTGGLVGFIGWEVVRQLEHLPDRPPAESEVPGQALAFVADLVVVDHYTGGLMLIANVLADGTDTHDTLWSNAQARLDAMHESLTRPTPVRTQTIDRSVQAAPSSRTEKADFFRAVELAKERIIAGDIFQVVISQRLSLECTASALDVYRVLRVLNPSPYMYLLCLEDSDHVPYEIVGSSPEALFKLHDKRAFTHPIAGSRPRGSTPEEDVDLERGLIVDAKERAEHLMLVDLARNDLLKVCESGSVDVVEFMRIARFSHIMHIVSSVEGNTRPGVSAVDVFRALFPAGTLSGAPKPMALSIIDELEPVQRGVYGGVIGYFDFSGDADLAIAIRTATIHNGQARVQAGGGLVVDSVPELEYQESWNKAAAPLRAVAIANTLRDSEHGGNE